MSNQGFTPEFEEESVLQVIERGYSVAIAATETAHQSSWKECWEAGDEDERWGFLRIDAVF